MRSDNKWWVLMVLVGVLAATLGCNLGKKGTEGGKTITVEETTTPVPAETTPTEVSLPEQPVYEPSKMDDLQMLEATLGAADQTLGWDDVFAYGSLEKAVGLFEELQPSYAPGSADRNFVDQSITDLKNIMAWIDEKMGKGEAIDPNGAEAKAKKKQINVIRARVQAMISGPAPKERIPEWQGDLIKKKWHERGEMLKKKWAERNKK